ncbi:MAG: hypothetical protein AAGD05_14195, partial [Bacteroidota bacterium]
MIKTVCDVAVDFRDTVVCPFQPVELDAHAGTNCLGCTWTWSDIGQGDSVRTLLPPSSLSVSVTLTDQVGCQRSDDLLIDVLNAPSIELGTLPPLCTGDSVAIGISDPSLTYEWSTGSTEPVIFVDTIATYSVTITGVNGCTGEDSINLSLLPPPTVDLGVDQNVCQGETISLDAGNAGMDYQWSPTNVNQQVVSYTIETPTTVMVTVTDVNNCSSIDTLNVVEVYSSPTAVNLTQACEPNNNFYQVQFELSGGDASTYLIAGGEGALTGNLFLSDSIPIGETYSFSLQDGNTCTPTIVSGAYDCSCLSDAGQATSTAIDVCGTDTVEIIFESVVLDENDVLEYVLHDGDAQNIGTILQRQNQARFAHLPGLDYGIPYFVSLMVGNDNGNGQVNAIDGCLAISEGVAITFYRNPIAIITPETASSLSCTVPTLVLSASTAQPFGQLAFSWTTEDGNILSADNEVSMELDQAGRYVLTVNDLLSGCEDTTHFVVTNAADLPLVQIETPGVLTCRDSTIQLDASNSSQGAEFEYLWTGGVLSDPQSLTPVVATAGTYELRITNTDNGCFQTRTVTVLENRVPPVVDLGNLAFIPCDQSMTDLVAVIETNASNFKLEWINPQGAIFNNTDLQVSVETEGNYQLQVQDLENGCWGIDEVNVLADPSGPSGAILDLSQPTCYGE